MTDGVVDGVGVGVIEGAPLSVVNSVGLAVVDGVVVGVLDIGEVELGVVDAVSVGLTDVVALADDEDVGVGVGDIGLGDGDLFWFSMAISLMSHQQSKVRPLSLKTDFTQMLPVTCLLMRDVCMHFPNLLVRRRRIMQVASISSA